MADLIIDAANASSGTTVLSKDDTNPGVPAFTVNNEAGDAIQGISADGGIGVNGQSASGNGVVGYSESGIGVVGTGGTAPTPIGPNSPHGVGTGPNVGVYGEVDEGGQGVVGYAKQGTGVLGVTNGVNGGDVGVYGQFLGKGQGRGIYGSTTCGDGIVGTSDGTGSGVVGLAAGINTAASLQLAGGALNAGPGPGLAAGVIPGASPLAATGGRAGRGHWNSAAIGRGNAVAVCGGHRWLMMPDPDAPRGKKIN